MSTVYILGAGSSKACIPNSPLNDDLLVEVLKLPGNAAAERIKEHIRTFYLNPNAIPPIEDILTQIDICIAEDRPIGTKYPLERVRALRRDLIYAICSLLHEKLGNNSPPLISDFMSKVAHDDAIISLNYDLIVDNSMRYTNQAPFYGFAVRQYLNYEPSTSRLTKVTSRFAARAREDSQDSRTLLKLHGSLNWLYCPSCRAIDVTPGTKGAVYIFREHSHRGGSTLVCRECKVPYEAYIVTPSFLKNYSDRYLRQIWQRAEDRLSRASQIVFIGYSLPDADIVFRAMISRALYRNPKIQKTKKRGLRSLITVVDSVKDFDKNNCQKNRTYNRYKNLFGEIEYLPDGFEFYVNHVMRSSGTAHP